MNDSAGRASSAKDLARQFVETLFGPQPQAILDLFAEDSWIHTTGSSMFSGKRRPAELVGLLGALGKVIPKGFDRYEIKGLIGDGDEAACQVLGYSISADGRPYNNHYVFWVQARGGRIALLSEFMDTRLVDEIFKSQVLT